MVPGRGYVCDEHEVVEYRDMVAIIRDRVKAMIAGGASLPQVKAARSPRTTIRAMARTAAHGQQRCSSKPSTTP